VEWKVLQEVELVIKIMEKFLVTKAKTTMIIVPTLDEFTTFLDFYYLCNDIVKQLGLTDDIELVTFHPEHQYEGTSFSDSVNFANRSPYPIVQLLRKSDLEEVGMTQEWKSRILEANEETLFHVGYEKLNQMLDEYRSKD